MNELLRYILRGRPNGPAKPTEHTLPFWLRHHAPANDSLPCWLRHRTPASNSASPAASTLFPYRRPIDSSAIPREIDARVRRLVHERLTDILRRGGNRNFTIRP